MRTTTPQDSSRDQLQQVRGSRLTAAIYDPFLWLGERLGMARRRADLLSGASGRVLEIGAGTGLNLAHYPTGLDELVVTEPARTMARRLDRRAAAAAVPLTRVPARAEVLPFDDDSFDTVVSTLVLCTVADPERAVAEIVRVLRPGGQLLFCEHVRAERGWRRNLQHGVAGGWEAFADGCRCDRPTLELIRTHFGTVESRTGSWRGMPAIVRPIVWGTATA